MGFVADEEEPKSSGRFVPDERRTTDKKVGWKDVLSPLDVAANLASGAIATPLSGMAGIAGTLLPGPEGQGARWTKKVGDVLTYQPRTAVGESAMEIISKPFELLHKGAVKVGETAQDLGAPPSVATGVQTAIETLPSLALMGRSTPAKSAKTIAAEMQNEVRDATYNAARAEGYKFPPSATNESFVNRRVEGAAGRPMLNQEMTIHNQKMTNKIAAREAGLPENTAITPGRLETRRNELAAPYREVAALDAATAQDLLDLRTARNQATKWYNYFDRSGNPMVEQRAKRFADKAELLEGYIEEAAKNAGKLDLVDRLRQARKEIAKTYDIERALIEGSGDISAQSLGAMLDKGKPLSGGLETIARAHQAFRPYMGEAVNIRNPGVDRIRSAIGIAASAAGAHGGIGWLSEGIPLAAGPARSLVKTDLYQNAIGKPSYPANPLTPQSLAGLLMQIQQAEQERR